MGELYFLRHAIAMERNAALADEERPLTDVGRAKLARQLDWARHAHLQIERVWSSPHLRCHQTAQAAATRFHCELALKDELKPGGDFESLKLPPGTLLVGHEPDLSEMIGFLLCGRRESLLTLKKAALAGLEWDGSKGRLIFLLPPRFS
jgi:phosphohistidine phosphatase